MIAAFVDVTVMIGFPTGNGRTACIMFSGTLTTRS
jgi:hypothetical protein